MRPWVAAIALSLLAGIARASETEDEEETDKPIFDNVFGPRDTHLPYQELDRSLCPAAQLFARESEFPPPLDPLPASVDFREMGLTTPPLTQGSCASSWALIAAAILETLIARETPIYEAFISESPEQGMEAEFPWRGNIASVRASPQYFLSCSSANNGCAGGSVQALIEELFHGSVATVELKANFPYLDSDNSSAVNREDRVCPDSMIPKAFHLNPVGFARATVAESSTSPGSGIVQVVSPCPRIFFSADRSKDESANYTFTAGDIVNIKSFLARGLPVAGSLRSDADGRGVESRYRKYQQGVFDHGCTEPWGAGNVPFVFSGYGRYRGTEVWIVRFSNGDIWGNGGFMYLPIGKNSLCSEQRYDAMLSRFFDLTPGSADLTTPFDFSERYGAVAQQWEPTDLVALGATRGRVGLDFDAEIGPGLFWYTGPAHGLVVALVVVIIIILVITFCLCCRGALCAPPRHILPPIYLTLLALTDGDLRKYTNEAKRAAKRAAREQRRWERQQMSLERQNRRSKRNSRAPGSAGSDASQGQGGLTASLTGRDSPLPLPGGQFGGGSSGSGPAAEGDDALAPITGGSSPDGSLLTLHREQTADFVPRLNLDLARAQNMDGPTSTYRGSIQTYRMSLTRRSTRTSRASVIVPQPEPSARLTPNAEAAALIASVLAQGIPVVDSLRAGQQRHLAMHVVNELQRKTTFSVPPRLVPPKPSQDALRAGQREKRTKSGMSSILSKTDLTDYAPQRRVIELAKPPPGARKPKPLPKKPGADQKTYGLRMEGIPQIPDWAPGDIIGPGHTPSQGGKKAPAAAKKHGASGISGVSGISGASGISGLFGGQAGHATHASKGGRNPAAKGHKDGRGKGSVHPSALPSAVSSSFPSTVPSASHSREGSEQPARDPAGPTRPDDLVGQTVGQKMDAPALSQAPGAPEGPEGVGGPKGLGAVPGGAEDRGSGELAAKAAGTTGSAAGEENVS